MEIFDFINEELIKRLLDLKNLSPANKRKVGTIIVNKEGKPVSFGYNYNQDGTDICENLEGKTFDTVIHAEESAIMYCCKNNIDITDATLICTYTPCIHCSRLIVLSGIKNLIFIDKHSENFEKFEEVAGSLSPFEFLIKNSINIYQYDIESKNIVNMNFSCKKCFVYHGVDADGWMGYYLGKKIYEDADFFQYNYEKNPSFMEENIYNQYIFVDCCPEIEFIEKLQKYNVNFLIKIFDHHVDRIAELKKYYHSIKENYPNIIIDFITKGSDTCGSKLFYDYNFEKLENKKIQLKVFSRLLNYVDYYDTWKWDKLDKNNRYIMFKRNILAFNAYIQTLITNVNYFYVLIDSTCTGTDTDTNEKLNSILDFGKLLLDVQKNNVINYLKNALFLKSSNTIIFEGVPNNFTYEIIRKTYGLSKNSYCMYIGYTINLDKQYVKFSVRSANTENTNCNKAIDIAKMFGGGGHEDAAGFTVPFENYNEIGTIIENVISKF